ncbi:FAD/NAD(P)-binding domain-containing protein [Marasmius fiardii PR-910]|nr:FAD/NAD(P)-binding domain-containing protein [Marasmius fiardii PR-910]
MDSEEGAFDIIVIGTGLTESIAAAALSKAGLKVAQIDENPYYGADEASLTQDEFVQWQGRQLGPDDIYSSYSGSSSDVLPYSRQYSLSLLPSVIPSTGPLISSLIQSGVSRYGGFRMIEQVAMYHSSGTVKAVPGSKEDIFRDKSITLVDKRRLMRFLKFASGEFEESQELEGKGDQVFIDFLKSTFSLNDEMSNAIAYALAYCQSPSDLTAPALQRLRRYLRSAGRYGPSPFLVGHYGNAGEIAQGFCRTSAVSGGVYILGRKITSVKCTTTGETLETHNSEQPSYVIHMDEFPEPLTCRVLISSLSRIPHQLLPAAQLSELRKPPGNVTTARCIAIIDQPLILGQEAVPSAPSPADDEESADNTSDQPPKSMDTGILIFPPASLQGGEATSTVDVLIVGEGTMSTPQGKWILYLSTLNSANQSPETLLKPYLQATVKLRTDPEPLTPIFTSYYNQRSSPPAFAPPTPASPSTSESLRLSALSNYIVVPHLSLQPLPEPPDIANINAEKVFWDVMRILRPEALNAEEPSFWPPLPRDDEDDEL